jgi:putative sugar O-methyltransferase
MKQAIKIAVRFLINRLPVRFKRYLLSILSTDSGLNGSQPPGIEKTKQAHELVLAALGYVDAGNEHQAEEILLQALPLDPASVAPHLSRVRFMKDRRASALARTADAELRASVAAMEDEIRRDALYVPSEFWHTYGKFHDKLLADYGIENFKRTVSHNYQNWLMATEDDPQVRQLLALWPQHKSHQPWLNAMEAPDHVGSLGHPAFTFPAYPLANAHQRETYRVAVGLLWEYVLSTDRFGVLETLTESEIGNPVRIWRNGKLISSDLAHSVRERNMLLEASELNGDEPLCVAELGAGHGRLAEVFGRTTNYRYIIFDITPALYVSQWYIKRIFPEEKIFEFRHFDAFSEIESELNKSRFAFFTSNQIELMPDGICDLFINMNSLMEMRSEQIKNFLHHIDRLTQRSFLSRQWVSWRNPVDGNTVGKGDFALGPGWKLSVDHLDTIYPDLFNQIWTRD